MRRIRLHRWSRIAAIALVAVTAALSLAPALHAGDGHDADCEPLVVVHDPSQHAFASTEPAESDALPGHEHCVTCHLFRISRLSQDPSPVHACESVCALTPPDQNFLLSDPASVPLPARAPPACSDLA